MSIEPAPVNSTRGPQAAITDQQAEALLPRGPDDPRDLVKRAFALFKAVAEAHRANGGIGRPDAPTQAAVGTVRRTEEANADELLDERIKQEVDPCLDNIAATVSQAEKQVEVLETFDQRVVTTAEGERLTIEAAEDLEVKLTQQIEVDIAKGAVHHRLVSNVWKLVAKLVGWVDIVAVMVFFAAATNINIFDPLNDLGGWLSVLALPGVMVTVQLWAARSAGVRFNERRQAVWEGRDGDADQAQRAIRGWAAFGMVVSLVVLALLVVRLSDMIAGAGLGFGWEIALMGFAVVIALGVPLVKAGVEALDGSSYSRRRLALAGPLQQQDEQRATIVEEVREGIRTVNDGAESFHASMVPTVAREHERARARIGIIIDLLYVLLGAREPHSVDAGTPADATDAPLPSQLEDRKKRMTDLQDRAGVLKERLDALQHAKTRESTAKNATL